MGESGVLYKIPLLLNAMQIETDMLITTAIQAVSMPIAAA